MDIFSLNNETCGNAACVNTDRLTAMSKQHEKPTSIKLGMSTKEISDVVSDRLVKSIHDQLVQTKK